jgi:hypothetical protein
MFTCHRAVIALSQTLPVAGNDLQNELRSFERGLRWQMHAIMSVCFLNGLTGRGD